MRISIEARQKIIDSLIAIGMCFGQKGRAIDFIYKVIPDFKDCSDIGRHYDVFPDIDDNRLFYSEFGLLEVSDEIFIKFLQEYMNPSYIRRQPVYDEDDELNGYEDKNPLCEKAINEGLALVGLEFVGNVDEYGVKRYVVQNKIQVPSAPIQNIIFASSGKKPDIVINNALENRVEIRDVGDALVYSDGIPKEGITWLGLADWYKQFEPDDTQNKLAVKLEASLDSAPEKLFFRTYCEYIIKNGRELPALIPQVYLYYDPKTKNERGDDVVFEHQRMDFMMILSPEHRIVIEIDGIQHYAENQNISGTYYKCANVDKYASMVKAHREMSLNGYDVYRFGGKELYVKEGQSDEEAKKVVIDFFDGLFKKYRLLPE